MKQFFRLSIVVCITFFLVQCKSKPTLDSCIKHQNDSLKHVFNAELKNLLRTWYPISIDTLYGGFLSDFSYNWNPEGTQQKMIVAQARHVWTCSQAFMKYKDSMYLKLAKHGFEFMKKRMWDNEYGGFYMLRNQAGNYIDEMYTDEKRAYGNTFAIYALTAYYNASNDTSALNWAIKTFNWLETHSYDKKYGGYFDLMNRKGELWPIAKYVSKSGDAPRAMWKDYNSSIHLLEAFTDLYKASKDSLVRVRLEEMLTLVRDSIVHKDGYLILHLTQDWKPISYRDSAEVVRKEYKYYDHVSFGHDVETAYLMIEASEALGIKNDRKTLSVAKNLVDHTLAKAWDTKYGGIFYEGYYFKNDNKLTIINNEKCWWAQAEMLNALLLMSQKYPNEPKYRQAFFKEWNYIQKYLIDNTHGGWYFVGLDFRPEEVKNQKASIWKVNYHDGRALLNCLRMVGG